MNPINPGGGSGHSHEYQEFPRSKVRHYAKPSGQDAVAEPPQSRVANWLFRGGLSEGDAETLSVSQRLLNDVFHPPQLPRAPYADIPVVGGWVALFQRQRHPERVERLEQEYAWQKQRAQDRAHREARIKAELWRQLVLFRGGHLHEKIQRQLETAVERSLIDDPDFGFERARLFSFTGS